MRLARRFTYGVAVGVAAVIAWCGFLLAAQRSVLFPAPPPESGVGWSDDLGAERVWLDRPGARSESWLLPALGRREDPVPLLIYAHGNGELIDYWGREFDVPRSWGAAVLLVEYPGYGRSSGRPSEATITAAMVAAYDWAVARPEIDRRRVVGYGRSLGGGAVCALARQRALAALVLESSFTSVRELATAFGLPGFLVLDPFDNLATVRAFRGPVLLIHGDRDASIPPDHARTLHAAAGGAELHIVSCGHNDCSRPWAVLQPFLRRSGVLPAPVSAVR